MKTTLRLAVRGRGARSCAALLCALALVGCRENATETSRKAFGGEGGPAAPAGLTPEMASRVLAKVGERTITLGDFAATLESMDQFNRLRYQSKERRKELLDEMIDVELLAADAKARGLDKEPETEEAIRQILHQQMLTEARRGLPPPADLPQDEVRAYYEAHRAEFREPERRQVAQIPCKDKDAAQKALADAKKAHTPAEWGEVYAKHSVEPPRKGPGAPPPEMAGQLGFVTAPTETIGENTRVPAALRAAVFQIGAVGEVLDHPVQDGAAWYVVRMSGKNEAHERTYQEAERSIRVRILQERIARREKELEAELRRQFPVTIDDKALGAVELPGALQQMAPAASASAAAPAASGGH